MSMVIADKPGEEKCQFYLCPYLLQTISALHQNKWYTYLEREQEVVPAEARTRARGRIYDTTMLLRAGNPLLLPMTILVCLNVLIY